MRSIAYSMGRGWVSWYDNEGRIISGWAPLTGTQPFAYDGKIYYMDEWKKRLHCLGSDVRLMRDPTAVRCGKKVCSHYTNQPYKDTTLKCTVYIDDVNACWGIKQVVHDGPNKYDIFEGMRQYRVEKYASECHFRNIDHGNEPYTVYSVAHHIRSAYVVLVTTSSCRGMRYVSVSVCDNRDDMWMHQPDKYPKYTGGNPIIHSAYIGPITDPCLAGFVTDNIVQVLYTDVDCTVCGIMINITDGTRSISGPP